MRQEIPGQNLAWLHNSQTVGEIVGSTRIFRLVSACAHQTRNPDFAVQYKLVHVALKPMERSAKPVFEGSIPSRCSNPYPRHRSGRQPTLPNSSVVLTPRYR